MNVFSFRIKEKAIINDYEVKVKENIIFTEDAKKVKDTILDFINFMMCCSFVTTAMTVVWVLCKLPWYFYIMPIVPVSITIIAILVYRLANMDKTIYALFGPDVDPEFSKVYHVSIKRIDTDF